MSNEQIDLFSYSMPKFKIDKPIRLIELFAGIGSQAKALKNLGVEFEHWKVIEIDKYAIQSYNAIHNTNFTPQDLKLTHSSDLEIVERESYTYILTYSFPCQDLSLAGLGKGMSKGTGTRSGLLWEVERILDECNGNLPQILLMENVPQVIGKKNIKDFQEWRRKLESLGYSNYVELLNAKNYGIPQNRNRCFMVSILGNYHYTFPKKMPLKLKLKDMLEDKVDEKYYISEQMIKGMINTKFNQYNLKNSFMERDSESKTLVRKYVDAPKIVTVDPQDEMIFKELMGGVAIKNNNSKGYAIANSGDGIDISSRMQHHRGTVQKGLSQTLDTQCNVGVIDEEISS
jgi:DNA (cytosine-5)-methyltransferase 1